MSVLQLSPEQEARLKDVLQLMGYEKLYPLQEESIRLNIANKQTLTLLSTGGGKTACYVIPGLVENRISIVVSPLIALQNDQVNALLELGIPAFLYNSDVGENIKKVIAKRLKELKAKKEPAFLFVSPESLISERFTELFGIGLFDFMAIDEVHCVSTWGNSFRPDYQRLEKAAKRLKIPFSGGYTATATSKIRQDIFRYTPLNQKDCVVVSGEFIRPNLKLRVISERGIEGNVKEHADKKKGILLNLVKKARGAVIVYCNSRRGAEVLATHKVLRFRLHQLGYSVYHYHAEVLAEEKRKVEYGFENDPKPIVFATNAFGMGIDRPDVGLVVHYNNPLNLLGYAQEIGRAGRDGEDASCVTFFDEDKIESSEIYRQFSLPTIAFVEQTHERLRRAFIKRKEGKSKTGFSTSKFMRMTEKIVGSNENFDKPERFLNRTRESLALLKQAGYVIEDGDEPFRLLKMTPGDKRHGRLIELTEMSERSEAAQTKAVADFFSSETPNQELLWQLLG